VTLLRHERLPRVSQPLTNKFDGPDRFVIDGLEPGDYEILVETAGLGVWRDAHVLLAAGETHSLDVQLARGLALRGRVVDAASGAPIEGALVISEEDVPSQVIPFDIEPPVPWSASAVTLSDGSFELSRLGAGPRTLRATKKGFGTGWSAPVDPASNELTANADVVVLRITRGGSVAGHVAHDDGKPWSGTIIVASHISEDQTTAGYQLQRMSYGVAETDALGDYAIPDLPAGEYVVLNVHDLTTASSVRQANVTAGAVTTVDLPERVAGARLTGRVLDHEGRPLAGLDVTLQPAGVHDATGWRSNRSDESGAFVFEGLHEGTYDVFVGAGMNRRFVQQDTLEVPQAGAVEHDIRLDAGAIRGRVTRAQDGAASADAFLLVEKLGAAGFEFAGIDFTANDGSFAIEHLRAGTWRVSAYPSQRGLAPQQGREITIGRDATGTGAAGPDTLGSGATEARCDLQLLRGAALRITVRDASGQAVAGATVTFTDELGDVTQLTATDVTGLAAGRWNVSARQGARSSPATVLDLLPGDDREIALQLAP
jgi:protocatechuate 3,4-dioxygenase beta subunit